MATNKAMKDTFKDFKFDDNLRRSYYYKYAII